MKKFLLFLIFGILMVTGIYFGSTKAEPQPTEVRASHILVNSSYQANQIRQDILDGKGSFESFAEIYSKCPSGQNGGDLGYFKKGQMVPQFEIAAFNLPVGEISRPIWTPFGWHIIKVTDRR